MLEKAASPARSATLEDVRAFASDPNNWDAFATLLAEVLPPNVRLIWGNDTSYKRHFAAWQKAGVTILPNHYYSPVPDINQLTDDILTGRLPLHGIHMDDSGQLDLLRSLSEYRPEFGEFADRTETLTDGRWSQGGPFARPDADAAYAIVRYLKPERIVEIGTGYSTLAMSEACVRNAAEGHPVDFVSIDPYPSHVVGYKPAGLQRQIVQPVEAIPVSFFASLSDNDILFIDSTHVLKQGNDVEYEYLRLLPNIGAGTWVHVHDIFLPLPYPQHWLTREHIFWNEQQLLAAFLAFNSEFTPTLALSYLMDKYLAAMREMFPRLPEGALPGSFWFKRRSAP